MYSRTIPGPGTQPTPPQSASLNSALPLISNDIRIPDRAASVGALVTYCTLLGDCGKSNSQPDDPADMLMGIPGDRLLPPITGPILHGPIDGGAGGLTVSLHPMHNRATRSVTNRWSIRPFLRGITSHTALPRRVTGSSTERQCKLA